ncbi:MAG TPA: hypothetical protein VEU55_03275 [Gemmatimonadales bacterium]|nr:hypothetical protein [Gemmatimonadales bacterium]
MRRCATLAAFLALAGAVAPAAAQERVVSDSQAASAVGETVTVEGTVASVHVSRSGTVFLNFGRPYPEQTFSAVIFRTAAPGFPDPKQWQGRRVRVTGQVRLYRARPEIILTGPNQLTPAP